MSCSVAGTYDIVADQGATFKRTITWKSASKQPYNLTGRTARMQVRSATTDPVVVLELTTENGRIALGGAAGTIDLLVKADVTAGLVPGRYEYDLELVSATDANDVDKIVRGNFVLRAEVTR